MYKYLFFILVQLSYCLSFGQWSIISSNYLQQDMVSEGVGYRSNTITTGGPTGNMEYQVTKILNDGATSSLIYRFSNWSRGCCRLGMKFYNDSVGVISISNQGLTQFFMVKNDTIITPWFQLGSSDEKKVEFTNDTSVVVYRDPGNGSLTLLMIKGIKNPSYSLLLSTNFGNSLIANYFHFLNETSGIVIKRESLNRSVILKTNNAGLNWDSILVTRDEINFAKLISDSSGVYTSPGEIYITENQGISWRSLNCPTSQKITAFEVSDSGMFFLGTENGNIFSSIDSGLTWNQNSTVSSSDPIKEFKIFNDSSIYALTNDDPVFGKSNILKYINITNNEKLKNSKTISINPNPATDVIYIQGDIQIDSYEFYNLNGELIYTDNIRELNIQKFKSGLYFLRVFHGNTVTIKKLIIQ